MPIVMLGIDLAKNVFALHGLNEEGLFGHEQLSERLNQACCRKRALEDASHRADRQQVNSTNPAWASSREAAHDERMESC
ncbi:MAG: hypothetical protein L6Q75_18925 [Burkholderiaceae bacterium]|nr:hypothetical protein [Burkholderiaceae bacterium]